jgi:hypothetical protein
VFFGSLSAEKLEGKYFGLLTSKIDTVEAARSCLPYSIQCLRGFPRFRDPLLTCENSPTTSTTKRVYSIIKCGNRPDSTYCSLIHLPFLVAVLLTLPSCVLRLPGVPERVASFPPAS